MNRQATDDLIKGYPSIDLAYPFAVESYDWAAKRLDAMDGRTQTILALGSSMTIAAPVIFSALKVSPNHLLFGLGIGLFLVGSILGIYSRLTGELRIITPKKLYQEWLHYAPAEFKKNMIFFAGDHMDRNVRVIARRHRILVIVTFIFSLELVCLVVAAALSSASSPVQP